MIYQGKELTTGILKTPVSSSLYVSKVQIEGDGQADLTVHGGPDKAICVYPEEHYAFWEKLLGKKLERGTFGENLTLRGVREHEIGIGDILAIGEVIVQVSQPRQPCHKLAKRLDWPEAVLRVQESGLTGYYFRVLKEGYIAPESEISRIASDEGRVTVAFANKLRYEDKFNREGIQRLLAVAALSGSWRQTFEKRLAELNV
ncbi:MOSC domain-containing protein [Paenibacillus roseipurpureus]|uniref:MOSC domain-containing protein n=1 Tax=Paenibacillus roseopurpureus TaxID=2918901 RepID=A0AA96RLK3_9BACL|nr:MOSC domain-containing protein [Paenibacillus sp. MBLB1832]WNR45514.1 MOSC domain-containing protein [Paenibacillus sp. MBLB1832]